MTDSSAQTAEAAPGIEKHGFGAEVGRLLDLVVHSLYSEREIFLRELVANAADAVDRRRFEALTDPTLALPDGAKVRIVPDKAARSLLISDDGVGIKDKDLAKSPEKRGSDYVAIFVRQLGGAIVPAKQEQTGTTVRIRLPLLLVPAGGAEPLAA